MTKDRDPDILFSRKEAFLAAWKLFKTAVGSKYVGVTHPKGDGPTVFIGKMPKV